MPKAKFEGICRSIKQKIEARTTLTQSLLPAESELITGVRLRPQYPAPGPGGPDRRRLPAAHPGQGGAGDLPAAGKTAFLIGVIESFQETDQRNNLHAGDQGGAVRAGGDRRAPASQSGFMVGEPLWAVERVRYLEGKALILDVNYFSQAMVPGSDRRDRGPRVHLRVHRKGAAHPHHHHQAPRDGGARHHPDEALLDLDGYGSVVVVSSLTFNADGLLFEYTQSRHQPPPSASRTRPPAAASPPPPTRAGDARPDKTKTPEVFTSGVLLF